MKPFRSQLLTVGGQAAPQPAYAQNLISGAHSQYFRLPIPTAYAQPSVPYIQKTGVYPPQPTGKIDLNESLQSAPRTGRQSCTGFCETCFENNQSCTQWINKNDDHLVCSKCVDSNGNVVKEIC